MGEQGFDQMVRKQLDQIELMPIYGKDLQKSNLYNEKVVGFGPWYVALGTSETTGPIKVKFQMEHLMSETM